jgi:hypothetical protein
VEKTLEDDLFGGSSEYDDRGPRIRWQPPATLPGCRDLGTAGAGAATFCLVDVVMMWAPLIQGKGHSSLPETITLLFLAFGLGALLVWQVGGSWRSYGIGLMVGWGAMTLLSAGYMTGVGP